jgi:long-chain acyl-CoA synthetase
MIIRAGMNIYPQEIENALRVDNRVDEVMAYGISDKICGEKIGLMVKGKFGSTDEIQELCKEKLPTYEWPSLIEIVDEIPKNGSGKIIRGKSHG